MMAINIFELENFLNSILKPWDYDDFCHNGIQIEGAHTINKIALGVSFNEEFISTAIKENCDLLLVHHGIFGKDFFELKGYLKRRVEKVIKNNLTLMAYHLPLDGHEEYGNNVSILKSLNLNIKEKVDVTFIGEYEDPILFMDFHKQVEKLFNPQPLLVYQNNKFVKTVGVCSGGGSSFLESVENKIDTFITGEVKEQTRNIVAEMGINFINAGHYSTEVFGIKNIGDLIRNSFGIEVEFIDIYNEI